MMYVISKATFGSYNVRDIQFNVNWTSCPYSDYASIPESMVDGILATQGYCDITLNSAGTEVVSYKARSIPSVPEECCGTNTVLSVNGVTANTSGEVILSHTNVGAAPAGYGLGGDSTKQITTLADLDLYTANGTYQFVASGATLYGINCRWAIVRNTNYDSAAVMQELFPTGSTTRLVRVRNANVWGEWEVDNPPMIPGVEYRTTKRHNGQAVYTKLLNYSPQSFAEQVVLLPHEISNFRVGLSIDVMWNKDQTQWRHFPSVYYADAAWNGHAYWHGTENICFECGSTLRQSMKSSYWNVRVLLEYTKEM